ncbi:hypothetical protein COHA_002896 [Chlorella ohadii]|uniref:Uncharacterized protein n=1 Tax=Chlorella ohadii TaxID=2649997 RepID=A0AAD5DVZ5_9CHLO|nr:hypothetical protein COHA_002896 [Chlorella ohadii]
MPLAITPLVPAGLYTAPSLVAEHSRAAIALPRAPSLAFAQPRTSSDAPQPMQPPTAAAAAAAAAQLGLPPAAAQLTIPAAKEKEPLMDTLKRAGQKALGGGVPGAAAMAVQVLSLMWLRTTVNYHSLVLPSLSAGLATNFGALSLLPAGIATASTTTTEALKHLYKDGGVVRFYRGLGPALLQGPLSRFGDTAANAGMLALLQDVDMPVALKTMAASGAAASFRIFLMPVDAMKTIMQVEGKGGFTKLMQKVRVGGPTVLYHGALAASAATFVGHYPWFFVYNSLNEALPQYSELPKRLLRSAFIGFCASAVSDTCSNSIRVVKTTKQAATDPISYTQAVKLVVEKDGVLGLFGRGLKTKIVANGLQGLMFSVLWRLGQDYMARTSGGS